MGIGVALLALIAITAVCARLFGALRGAVVVALLLVIAGMTTYKFVDSGGAMVMVLSFAAPVILGAIGLGSAAGAVMKRGNALGGAVLLAIPVGIWLLSHAKDAVEQENERKVVRYIRTHPEVVRTLGDGGRMLPASRTTSGAGSLPSRYEYALNDRYVIVDATYSFWTPTFSLACITRVPMGQRNAFGDICKQQWRETEPPASQPSSEQTVVREPGADVQMTGESPKPQPGEAKLASAEQRIVAGKPPVEPSEPPKLVSGSVHVVAVYQAKGAGGNHNEGTIRIEVGAKDTPVTLVLSSYEPVHWLIQADPGVEIAKVVLMGYYPGRASGVEAGKVSHAPGHLQDYNHKNFPGGSSQQILPPTSAIVEKTVGKRPNTVEGTYEANYFSLNSVQGSPSRP